MIADLLWVLTAFIAVGLILKVMVYPLGQVLVLLWALSELSEDWYEHKPWKKNALILFGTSLLHQLFKTILDSIIQESKKGSNIK
jgi:ABC-type arginine/histidine transport system permease subunit